MKVSVFGLGYVGAVSCACLPELGHEVVGVDINALKVELIASGQSPVVEEGIEELISAAVKAGKLRATNDVAAAVQGTEVSLISVATPSLPNYMPDLTALDAVVGQIGAEIAKKDGHHTLVIRSTVAPGTTRARIAPLLEKAADTAYGENRLAVATQRVKALKALKRDKDAQKVVADALEQNGQWFPKQVAQLKAALKS